MAHSTLANTQETVDEVFCALEARGLLSFGQTVDRYELVYQVSKEIAPVGPAEHSPQAQTLTQSH